MFYIEKNGCRTTMSNKNKKGSVEEYKMAHNFHLYFEPFLKFAHTTYSH